MNLPLRDYLDLLGRYLRPQRGWVMWLALLLIGGIGLQLLAPQVIRYFIDTVQTGGTQAALPAAAGLFVGLVVIERVVATVATYVSQTVAWRATNGLRSDLARHVTRLDMGFHNARTPGELLERIDGDVDLLANFFSQFVLQILTGLLLAGGVLVLLFLEDWRVGAVLAVFVALYVAIHAWDQRWAAPAWRLERQYSAELSGFVEERVAGGRDLHTSGAVGYTLRRVVELLRRLQWQALRGDVTADLAWSFSNIFYQLGTVAGLGLGAYLFLRGSVTLGVVYLIVHYLGMLNGPLNRIGTQLEDLQRVRIAIERVKQLNEARPAVADGLGTELPITAPLTVRFDRVSFRYHDEAPVLEDVSFTLEAGQTLGLLGRTGSGKTTLSRLLVRLYDAQAGSVELSGVDIRRPRLAELRRSVGLVTQEVQLFGATVRDNLALFDPTIGDDAIFESLTWLGLDGWVEALPSGLDTELTADGAGLSAGEGQLLALARVFLKDPGLIILDEASSRLDPATERRLDRALDGLLQGRTGIVIAHRLATLHRADQILILERGRVKEYGPYQELAGNADSTFAGLLRTGLEEVLR